MSAACDYQWAPPRIQWDHVDGPLLRYSDGQLHWLTLFEWLAVASGLSDAETIQTKRRPELTHQEKD